MSLVILPANIYQFTLMDFFLTIPRDLYMQVFATDRKSPSVPSPYQESILEHHRLTLSKTEFRILQQMSAAFLGTLCHFHPHKWAPAFDYVSIEDVLSLSMLGTHRMNMTALTRIAPELDLVYGSKTDWRWKLIGAGGSPFDPQPTTATATSGLRGVNQWILVQQWCQKLAALTAGMMNVCTLDGRGRDSERIQTFTNRVNALRTAMRKAFDSGKVAGSGLPVKFATFQNQILQGIAAPTPRGGSDEPSAQSIWTTQQATLEVHRTNDVIDYIRVQPSAGHSSIYSQSRAAIEWR